jgi:prepilin peptidase CpaA
MLYFLIAAAAVAAVAAWTDARTGHIPNWLTFGALVAAVPAHLIVRRATGGTWDDAIWDGIHSLGGALLCGLVPALMYWKGAIGGGDVKLFAALGALCQPMAGLEVETYAFVAAALIAPAKLAYQGALFKTLGRSLALVTNPFRKPEKRLPLPDEMKTWFRLGPAVFLGAAVTLFAHWNAP